MSNWYGTCDSEFFIGAHGSHGVVYSPLDNLGSLQLLHKAFPITQALKTTNN